MAPPREVPMVRARRIAGMPSNALVSGVVGAIVAGLISFGIAHYQDQDAARQAASAQQASAALQLETAATGLYQATFDLWPSCEKNPGICLDNNAYVAAEQTFNAASSNVSDPRAAMLAKQLANSSTTALASADLTSVSTNLNQLGETYGELITRCGQLVQGEGE
jgi:type II secretory pathway pseudopilin PulG